MQRMIMTATLVVLVSSALAWGEGGYLDAFKAKYSIADGHKFDTCNLCHAPFQPKSVRNQYGISLADSGAASNIDLALTRVEPVDSDLDVATNIAEILNSTWPGDPNDTVPVNETAWGRIKALYK